MIYALIIAAIVIFDQIVKYFSVTVLAAMPGATAPFIPGFMNLTYAENTGAAFGSFGNATWLLAIVSGVMAVVIIYLLFKYKKQFNSKLFNLSMCFIAGGAIGNLIDRLFVGHVVDMLEFDFVRFAIFNVADCFVTFGAIMLGVFVIWFWEKNKKDKHHEA
ncbi:MAG: signal peptidase II [Christensenellaceae bacterium]